MPNSFDVKEKKGVLWIKWGDVEGILVPVTEGEKSQAGGSVSAGPTGAGVNAKYGKTWVGDSIFIIRESGQTAPFDVWSRKKELEAGLLASGLVANISSMYSTTSVSASAEGSARGTVVSYARVERWVCPECGTVVEPNVSHSHVKTS